MSHLKLGACPVCGLAHGRDRETGRCYRAGREIIICCGVDLTPHLGPGSGEPTAAGVAPGDASVSITGPRAGAERPSG